MESSVQLESMQYGILYALVALVHSYVLVFGFDRNKFIFQTFIPQISQWHLRDDDEPSKFDCGEIVRSQIKYAPHVVVGSKLHVSLGNRSFGYDVTTHTWNDSVLFDNFWNSNKNVFSPLNFYGGKGWNVTDVVSESVRGLPFGFYGKWIFWDGELLLGVHRAPDCAIVAFLLRNGVVDKSQCFSLEQLGLDCDDNLRMYGDKCLGRDSYLVNFGEGGYFGLVHLVYEDKPFTIAHPKMCGLELVTFKVSKVSTSDDSFLGCKFVRKEFVGGERCSNAAVGNLHAFSVDGLCGVKEVSSGGQFGRGYRDSGRGGGRDSTPAGRKKPWTK